MSTMIFESARDFLMCKSVHNETEIYLAGHYRFGLHLKGPIRISSRLHWVGSIRISSRLHWEGSIRISSTEVALGRLDSDYQ